MGEENPTPIVTQSQDCSLCNESLYQPQYTNTSIHHFWRVKKTWQWPTHHLPGQWLI